MSREQTLDAAGRPHLTQRDLAIRWSKAEATIARYRSDGRGPRFLKIGGAVLYRLEDIERFERESLYGSPSSRCEDTDSDITVPGYADDSEGDAA
ncbi:hypothetical protein C2I33_00035 [Ralstonia solanacearum]|uniref:helix-turn-helix transcriptional regulator n=1 Tax=Ralstonia solanacearum TaxID=305 RepID=UPI0005AC1CC6|nr:hypothetical protein [Ralstonia solanacearum]MDC6176298.1 DNA-binding protein [Ralstonia solanacearum]MDC6212686.1 DNA-binding protein [Ralstonia solanacearum]MDC6239788.1 DNA-binding protein [Ralstonia solanacearum]MDD7803233.1 DNA-binding protein [Ralstonia solanacearum]TYZ56699.1 hypothetical protein C2I33_00035 [Ralstonia solanacearum]